MESTPKLKTYDPDLWDFYVMLHHATNIPLRDLAGREVVCTPCGGNYGCVAYWLLAVNGSPPRGTILFDANGYTPTIAFLIDAERSRRLGAAQARIVEVFVRRFLGKKGHWSLEKT